MADKKASHNTSQRTNDPSRPVQTRSAGNKHTGKKPSGAHHKSQRRKKRRRPQHGRELTWKEKLLHINYQYVLLGLIVLIALFCIIRLIIWNIGKDSGYDSKNPDTEFVPEALDYIQPLNPKYLEGREDDGQTTIVCLGNAPFADDRGDKDSLSELITAQTGATVYNCAFENSYLSMKNASFSAEYPQDAMSLYLTTVSMCNENFELMDNAMALMPENSGNQEALETLKGIDFSKVDMIVIMYDMADYIDGRPVMDANNDINLITWNGALNASLKQIQQSYPYIRTVVLSPAWGEYEDDNGKMQDSDLVDSGNGTLADYLLHEIDVAIANGVSILDNYYGTINMEDKASLKDGYHLNAVGRRKIVKRFVENIFPQANENK